MIPYNIIATGSQGNAVLIGGVVLVDCGVPFSALREVYRYIKIVLLTHIHTDHFAPSTIRRLAYERPMLRFACGDWMVKPLLDAGVCPKNIDVLKIGVKYDYRTFKVMPIKLYHDVPNCGWRLFIDGEKVFYATDTRTLTGIRAKGYDLYMVEANYEMGKIIDEINRKKLAGQYAYEMRSMQTHLSKEECDEFIAENKGPNSKYIYMHQHKYSEEIQ